jgi:hypothetical protein
MPGIPRISGTIALPSFDSSGMTIDEGMLRAAERGEPPKGNGTPNGAGNAERSSGNANVQR